MRHPHNSPRLRRSRIDYRPTDAELQFLHHWARVIKSHNVNLRMTRTVPSRTNRVIRCVL